MKEGRPPAYVDGTWGNNGVAFFDLVKEDKVPIYTAEVDYLVDGTKTVVFKDGTRADFDEIIMCTGFRAGPNHWRSFMSPELVKAVMSNFRGPRVENKGAPGLWTCLGGFVSTRYGQVIMAKRISRLLQIPGAELPGIQVTGNTMWNLVGPDPAVLTIPVETIAINLAAVLAIGAKIWSRSSGRSRL